MKMSVSVPKELSRQVEDAAHQLGISPSELVRRAMRAFVETLPDTAVADAAGLTPDGGG